MTAGVEFDNISQMPPAEMTESGPLDMATDKATVSSAGDQSKTPLTELADMATTADAEPVPPEDDTKDKTFDFLGLASELRNAVYSAVLEDHEVYIPHRTTRPLQIPSALMAVNKLVHDEFLSFAKLQAPVIRARVIGLRFGHVISYLNRMSERQLKQVKRAEGTARSIAQAIKIELVFDWSMPNYEQALRWLRRFDVPEKRAADIRFDYAGSGGLGVYGFYMLEFLQVASERMSDGARGQAAKMLREMIAERDRSDRW